MNGTIRTVKGPRKPKGMDNPCFTVNIPSAPKDPDFKTYNGTILINFYADNYQDGNANMELMGPAAERIDQLFDDQTLNIDGYENYNLVVDEPLGPLRDNDFPEEHFMSIRLNFGIRKL